MLKVIIADDEPKVNLLLQKIVDWEKLDYQIADTTEALATFFRYTITDVDRLVTLSDELENVEDYCTIQKFRFGDRMNLELELNDEEILSARMPRLVLQPLVENAIAHGHGRGRC